MVTAPSNQPRVLAELGKLEWMRAHISIFAVGAVLLACANLLIGGGDLWSLTAIGIWALLLLVHAIVLIIARLSGHLLEEDEEEVVLLPIKEAVFTPGPVSPPAQPESTPAWPPAPPRSNDGEPPADANDVVSWKVATDKAHLNKPEPPPEPDNDR